MSEVKCPDSKQVTVPWGAWFGDRQHKLKFPKSWNVNVHGIADASEAKDSAIEKSIQNPIGAKTLRELAVGKKKIVIAVEDITRPSKLERVLFAIFQELCAAGIGREKIFFIVCNGAHAPMLKGEIEKKLGVLATKNFRILNHCPYENLSDTGIVLGKTPILINRDFLEADLRIALGTIIPHSFAGFSAGAKLMIPGLADIATLERTHKYVMMGFRGGINDVETNKFRMEIEEVAKKVGLDFFIGVVPNSNRETAGVFAGDIIASHRAGVKFARRIYKTAFEPNADIVVLNAYPKDSELLQADTALTPLNSCTGSLASKDGVVIITSSCSNGFGYHSLLGPGMRLSRKPIKKRNLKGRDFILFSPNVNKADFLSLYWEGYSLVSNWDSLINDLKQKFAQDCRVSVFPTAPLQLLL